MTGCAYKQTSTKQATPLCIPRKPQPLTGRAYKQTSLSSPATPLSMPRKPQPLTGRAARCAPHQLTCSLRSLVRWLRCLRRSLRLARASLSRRLRRRASRSAAAPFSPAQEWWPDLACAGWVAVDALRLPGVRGGAVGAREQRVRGRPVARRGGAVSARLRPRLGRAEVLRLLCCRGCGAVAVLAD